MAIYLEKFAKRTLKHKNNTKMVNTIQQLLAIISNSNIAINYKNFASKALDSIINAESNIPLKI